MNLDFTGQTIIVTGATRGIGKQIAEDLHSMGAELILTGTDPVEIKDLNKIVKLNHKNIRYFCVNFLIKESIDYFKLQLTNYKQIHALVNNAGINRLNFINEVNDNDWDDMLSVNLTAPFQLLKFISSKMIPFEFGRIINIASIFSKISKEKRSVYSVTKFGIHGLTVGVSNDLARHNILVNTVSPGFVYTDLTKKNLTQDEIIKITEQIPIKRLANVKEISYVVLFLLSKNNTYLTGQNIVVDGGFTNV
jgi:3-oxoacyl-[acyl-carrier protein] reductase